MISVDDIGWFVAKSFANPDVYLGKAVDIAGDSLSIEEIKMVYKNVTGRSSFQFQIAFLGYEGFEF